MLRNVDTSSTQYIVIMNHNEGPPAVRMVLRIGWIRRSAHELKDVVADIEDTKRK
jgi:hypothetical protein